jgi:hypothetical protein
MKIIQSTLTDCSLLPMRAGGILDLSQTAVMNLIEFKAKNQSIQETNSVAKK